MDMNASTSKTTLRIRRAKLSEAGVVAKVTRNSFVQYKEGSRGPKGAFLSRAVVRRHMRTRRKGYGVALLNGKVVGVIGYRRHKSKMIFGPVGVPPQQRRQGVGGALIAWCESRAKALGCKSMEAEVLRSLPTLIQYYQGRGFRTFRKENGRTYAAKRLS